MIVDLFVDFGYRKMRCHNATSSKRASSWLHLTTDIWFPWFETYREINVTIEHNKFYAN